MKILKKSFYTSILIFISHFLIGLVYTILNDPSGIIWLNPFWLFLMLYWVYFIIVVIYIYLIEKKQLNEWLIAIVLMAISFVGMHLPFILESTFNDAFEWKSVNLLIATIPIMVFTNRLFDKGKQSA